MKSLRVVEQHDNLERTNYILARLMCWNEFAVER